MLEVDAVCLDFSKAFDTIFYSILLEKLADHCLDGCTALQVENWLDGQPQRAVMSYIQLTASHKWCTQSSGPALFNIFVNDLDKSMKCICRQSAYNTS